MSKVDAMRALREARRAELAKGSPAPARTARPAATSPSAAKPARPAAAPASEADGAACGHRNMGGKSCTRPAGHSEKNHRYS